MRRAMVPFRGVTCDEQVSHPGGALICDGVLSNLGGATCDGLVPHPGGGNLRWATVPSRGRQPAMRYGPILGK